ncbi:hAT family dimerization protein [Ceratobasidium sp. AG-Ba]|nr:hAT family dimerization protein [Ceratobasidium sp. AG-Ba]
MSSQPTSESNVLGKRVAPTEPPRQRVKRHKGLNAMTDAEAEKFKDIEILGAFKQTLRSSVYEHYVPRLERHFDGLGNFDKLVIRFECKHDNQDHSPVCRDRLKSGDGTRRLIVSAQACDRQRGVTQPASQLRDTEAATQYSEARHRAILVLQCARYRRSFESAVDDLHREEVDFLRPGTSLPTSATLSTTAKHLYSDSARDAALYLQQVPGALHLALDGWTAPTSESYLGVVIFWREESKIWRTVLEFIRLTEAHTGNYLAECIHRCLERFGITEKVMSACMDNASNNDTLVRRLKRLAPSFRGTKARLRCLAHIINLMAKAFMSLFSPPPKRTSKSTSEQSDNTTNQELEPDPAGEVDGAKLDHDLDVVKGVAADAIRIMKEKGVNVAGLARRVNDSAELNNIFRETVDRDPSLHGDARALTRRVATRWNTNRAALNSHIHFRDPVQLLTSHPKHDLKKYALDDDQWDLASELNNVLEVFQEPTDRFSQAEVPLIHQVIPELLTLKARLGDIRDNTPQQKIHPITQVAAQAALLVYEKYLGAIEESDIYVISVEDSDPKTRRLDAAHRGLVDASTSEETYEPPQATATHQARDQAKIRRRYRRIKNLMCPDRKLQWFADCGYDTKGIRSQAVQQFKERYATKAQTNNNNISSISEMGRGNIWTQNHSSSATASTYRANNDCIEAYFNSPCISSEIIAQHGGILGYWHHELKRRPAVARMALDYLTAPATSVDAERAFSGGRLMIDHLQHQMSAQTFQAQIAIGAWFGTPLLPDVSYATRIIEKHM